MIHYCNISESIEVFNLCSENCTCFVETFNMDCRKRSIINFLALHGNKTPVHYTGSHMGYKRCSIFEKYDVITQCEMNLTSLTLYRNVMGHVNSLNTNEFIIDSHSGSVSVDVKTIQDIYKELPILINDFDRTLVCLSDAAYLKCAGYLPETYERVLLANFSLYANIVLPDYVIFDLPRLERECDLLKRIVSTREDLIAADKLAVEGVSALIDRVRVEFEGKPLVREEELVLSKNSLRILEGEGVDDEWGFPFNVPKIADRANRILGEIQDDDIINRVNSILNTIEFEHAHVIKFVSTFMHRYCGSVADNVLCDAILFIDCVRALVSESWYSVISCCVRLGSRLGINSGVLQQFREWILSQISSGQVRVGGDDRLLEIEGGLGNIEVGHIFTAFLGVLLLQQMPNKSMLLKVTEFARSFNIIIPTIKSLKQMLEYLPKFMPAILQSWLQVICPAEAWFNFVNGGFREWSDRCELFLTPQNETRCKYDNEVQKIIMDLHEEGKKYIDLAVATPDISPRLFQLINKLAEKVDSFVNLIEIAKGSRGHRKAPFVVSIFGQKEIGKSNMISHIANLLRPDYLPKNNLIYCRQAGADFWDGYTGQFCVSYDDYTQFIESKDYKEMVSMCTSEVYHLDMASLTDKSIGVKGQVFVSDLVVTTTNIPYPTINDARTQEAIWRRRHLLWELEVLPEYYVNGSVDWDNIPDGVHEVFGFYRWRLRDPLKSEGPLTEWMTSEAAFEIIFQKWQRNRVREEYLFAQREDTTFSDGIRARLLEVEGLSEMLHGATNKAKEFVSSFNWEKIKEEINHAKEIWYGEHPKVKQIAALMGAVGGFLGAFLLMKTFTADTEEERILNEESAGPMNKVARTTRMNRKNVMRFAEGAHENEGLCMPAYDYTKADEVGYQYIKDILSSSMVYGKLTYVFDGVEKFNHMCGFAIGWDFVMFPMHLYMDPNGDFLKTGTLIVKGMHNASFDTIFDPKYLHFIFAESGRKKDVTLYKFGSRMRPFPKRIDVFINKEDVSTVRNKPGVMMTIRDDILNIHHLPKIMDTSATTSHYNFSLDCSKYMTISTGWEYFAHTGKGDCGSLICVQDPRLQRKICGIHVASEKPRNMGVAEIVYQEDLQPIVDLYTIKVCNLPKPSGNVIDTDPRFLVPEGNFSLIGKIPDREVLRLPQKSSICPSLIYEQVAIHVTEPAVLSPTDPRLEEFMYPLANGIAKYGKPSMPFDWIILQEIIDDVVRQLKWPFVEPLFVLSLHQSINGIEGKEYFDALNMQSSPGWPYKLRFCGKTKKALFEGDIPQAIISDKDLQQRLEFREQMAKQGIRVPSAWVDCLKDERRKLEKILKGKTRVFAIAPLDFVILMRKYYLAFAARFYNFRKYGWSAVGIDCESSEWNATVNYLLENSDKGFAGDFGKFDGTLSSDCMQAVLEIIERCYESSLEDQRVRATLFSEIIHTVHLALDAAYVCHGGNPSGNPLTVVLNSIVNFIYMSYAWIKLAPVENASMRSFHENVHLKIYGDDNWISVKEHCLEWYNLETVSQFLQTLGIEYTGPQKDGIPIAYDDILKWSFLKRVSVRVPEISNMLWLAKIDVDVVNELTNWIRMSDDEYLATVENVQTALRFAFFFGKTFFEDFRQRISRAFIRKNQNVPALMSWMELRSIFLEKDGFRILDGEGDTEQVLNVTAVDGINLPEEQIVQVNTGKMENRVSKRANADMPDTKWDLVKMVERPNYVGTYAWNVSQPVNTTIQGWYVPQDLHVLDINQTPFNHFVYWRGDVLVRFQLNGTRFHCGRLIAYFGPLMTKDEVESWHRLNKAAQTSLDHHAFLDPSISSTVELCIPFVSFRNYIFARTATPGSSNPADVVGNNLSSWILDFLGTLRLQVFNPLQATTGASTSVNVSVWVSFPNSEFHIPVLDPTHLTFEDEALKRGFVRVEKDGKVKEKSLASAMRNLNVEGNTVSSKVTNVIERAGNITMPIEVVGDKIDANLALPGMDKVNVGLQPMYVVRKPLGYVSHSENLEFLQRMCLKPSALTLTDEEHFATQQDEMDISYLASKSTFLREIAWPMTAITGQLLDSGVLSPIDEQNTPLMEGPVKYCSNLHYLSLPFTFWRGGLVFHFDIVATAFMTGKLWFGIHYGQNGAITMTMNEATDQYGFMIDLNAENHHYTFHVPFVNCNEWLRVSAGYGSLEPRAGAPVHFDSAITSIMGFWDLIVLNPLVAPDGSPASIAINMFVSGADDFELSFLGCNNAGIRMIEGQGSTANVDKSMPATPLQRHSPAISLNIGTVGKKNFSHFGEQYRSLREVMKRYTLIETSSVISAYETSATLPYFGLLGKFKADTFMTQGRAHHWFSSMYRVWRGSVRYKVQFPKTTLNVAGADVQLQNLQPMLFFDPIMYSDSTQEDNGTGNLDAMMMTTYAYDFINRGINTITSSRLLTLTDPPVPPGAVRINSCVMPPSDWSNDGAAYHEIEVPFQTMFNLLKVSRATWRVGFTVPRDAEFTENPGYVFIGFYGDQKIFGDNATKMPLNISGAAGDDFRCGLHLGPHAIWAQGFQIILPEAVVAPFFGDTRLVP